MAQTRRLEEWARLEDALADAGIDRGEFERVAVAALEEVRHRAVGTDPASAFTIDEAQALASGGFDLSPRRDDEPDVFATTASAYALLLVDAASVEEVATALRVTRARVRQRAHERTLYAVRERDEWRFPRWQFDEGGRPIRGFDKIMPAVPRDLHPVAVWRFLSEPDPDLEVGDHTVSPLAWLRAGGEPAPIADAAREL